MSQSLDRALTLLGELGSRQRTLEELAGALGVHKSTALRMLRTLESHHFVHRVDAYHYRLGSALFDLAHRALDELDERRTAQPFLAELNERTGHTVHLAAYEGDQVVYIDKFDGRQPVRMYSRVGRRAPVHCTAVGKALVASWSRRERTALAERLDYPAMTSRTLTEQGAFLDELETVRRHGYAVDRGEHEDFVHCVAAPVRGVGGSVLAALSLSAPKMVLDFDGLMSLVPAVVDTARRISAELCGPGISSNDSE